jgi:hypothetical protein
LQLSVRKRAFEHAVRLPLHRVHELKSGGIASVLREDAGSVGTCSQDGICFGSGLWPSTLSTTNFVANGGNNPSTVEMVNVTNENATAGR